MKAALFALCCICVAGVLALAIRALGESPVAVAASAIEPSDDARLSRLERELGALRAEVEALRAGSGMSAPPRAAAPAEGQTQRVAAASVDRDPAWYLREYERSFAGRPQGSDHFRLAVEAYVVELADEIARRLADRSAVPAFRVALARLLADARLGSRRVVIDALFAALFEAEPTQLSLAALESLFVIGGPEIGPALEAAWPSIRGEKLRDRALTVILGLSAEPNAALARLFARSALATERAELAGRVVLDPDATALELLRPASTDEESVRLAAAEALRELRGPRFLTFVDTWIGYERSESVRRVLGAVRASLMQIPSYSPEKAVGPPDAVASEDHPNAWASAQPDMGLQWLDLRFEPARRVNRLRIHEVCVAGAVTRVVAFDPAGGEHLLWSGTDPTSVPGVFELTVPTTGFLVARVRLVLDTDRAPGWSEIDAVQVDGPDGAAWASGAGASSYFGEG